MIQLLPVLPILIPLLTAIASLFFWENRRTQRIIGFFGSGLAMICAILLLGITAQGRILVVQVGAWPAPFGISLVADILAGLMVFLSTLSGLAVGVFGAASVDSRRKSFGYYPLSQILMMGINGAFLTGDIFNLYVFFEIMLISSFVLLSLGGERPQIEGAVKYVTLNLLGSFLFLIAVGFTYSLTGSLNMADLAMAVKHNENPELITVISMLFLVAFGSKSAVFPLFFWLPASYHTPPSAVSALFAGLLTKVGVYALIRSFTLIFIHDVEFTHSLILLIAGLTMITGVLGAVAQNEFRRILSFHIVSQIGYMVMGLGLYTPLAMAGSVFYIAHHIIVKTNLFLVAGLTQRLEGTHWLKRLGGMSLKYPWLAILFLIPALSLAGIPPLSGFWAKLILIRAGLEEESYMIVLAALLAGLLTLFSMTKIWSEAFWKEAPESQQAEPRPTPLSRSEMVMMVSPIVFLALMTIAIGFGTEWVLELSMNAADQLLDPSRYISAVLGEPTP